MKKDKIFVLLFTLVLGAFTLTNCGDDEPIEVCSNDNYCDDKSVTACCDENQQCVYKYNGKEYAEDEQDQLADDLGCSGTNARVDASAERAQLIAKLEALLERTRAMVE